MTQPDAIPKSFRVELKTELPYWLVILPGIFLFGVITKPSFISTWPLMLILSVALVTWSVLTYRLNLIEIDTMNGEATLTKTNLLRKKRVRSYTLSDLQFTYKKGKTSLYSRVVNICRLYLNDKEIAAIIPDQDGWTDDTVNDLARGLVNLNVSKKFIGYSAKDAEINGL
jgi:hypothetical protein